MCARGLADEFVAAKGDSVQRLALLVRRHWGRTPMPVRAGLVAGLLPLLEPLEQSGGPLTDELRRACEQVASQWLARR